MWPTSLLLPSSYRALALDSCQMEGAVVEPADPPGCSSRAAPPSQAPPSSSPLGSSQAPRPSSRRRYPVAQVKGGWSSAEDHALKELVAELGQGRWTAVAKALNQSLSKPKEAGRIGKQCRERWNHHLDPCISKQVTRTPPDHHLL